MSNLSIPPSPEHSRRVLAIGFVRRTANRRTITTIVTEAGGRGRVTPATDGPMSGTVHDAKTCALCTRLRHPSNSRFRTASTTTPRPTPQTNGGC